jgi:hypothetical protein
MGSCLGLAAADGPDGPADEKLPKRSRGRPPGAVGTLTGAGVELPTGVPGLRAFRLLSSPKTSKEMRSGGLF